MYWNLPAAWKASAKKWRQNWFIRADICMAFEDLAEAAEQRVQELEDALAEIRDLARTGYSPAGLTQHEWNVHKLNMIAGMANEALDR